MLNNCSLIFRQIIQYTWDIAEVNERNIKLIADAMYVCWEITVTYFVDLQNIVKNETFKLDPPHHLSVT